MLLALAPGYGVKQIHSRIDGRNRKTSTISQHGSSDVGVVHLHHEGARNACAFLYLWRSIEIFILSSVKHKVMSKGSR